MESSVPFAADGERKRGRPAGKDRTPLTPAERRARNAGYERQRRADQAAALTELAEALEFKGPVGNSIDIVSSAIAFIKNSSQKLKKRTSEFDAEKQRSKILSSKLNQLKAAAKSGEKPIKRRMPGSLAGLLTPSPDQEEFVPLPCLPQPPTSTPPVTPLSPQHPNKGVDNGSGLFDFPSINLPAAEPYSYEEVITVIEELEARRCNEVITSTADQNAEGMAFIGKLDADKVIDDFLGTVSPSPQPTIMQGLVPLDQCIEDYIPSIEHPRRGGSRINRRRVDE